MMHPCWNCNGSKVCRARNGSALTVDGMSFEELPYLPQNGVNSVSLFSNDLPSNGMSFIVADECCTINCIYLVFACNDEGGFLVCSLVHDTDCT